MDKQNQTGRILKIEHYILGRTVGLGAFGKVKIAKHEFTGNNVAIKIINKEHMRAKDMTGRVKREIRLLRYFNHPNIIRLYEVLETQTDIFVVMEYAPKGELSELINPKAKLDEAKVKYLFRQLIAGVEYCHSNLIAHRDLKLENVLLDEYGTIKIADFGLSNLMKDGKFLKTDCGSPHYAAPEILSKKRYCGVDADIWSLGVILFTLLAGNVPFDANSLPALCKKITMAEYKIPDHISPEASDLIKGILQPNPIVRLKFHQIINHPWLRRTEVFYLDPKQIRSYLKPINISGDLFESLKNMGFNFRNLPEEKIRECIKRKKDYSFVVGYTLMFDETVKAHLMSKAPKKEDEEAKPISEVANLEKSVNKNTQKVINPHNDYRSWHYGLRYQYPAKILMASIIETLLELNTIYTEISSNYKIKCFHHVEKQFLQTYKNLSDSCESIAATVSTTCSNTTTTNHSNSSKFNKYELAFDIKIYSLSTETNDHVIDIQRISGHSIMFLDYCRKFIYVLNKNIPLKLESLQLTETVKIL